MFAASWLLFVLLTALQPCCDAVAEASPHQHDAVAEVNPEPHGQQQANESGHTHCDMFSQWQKTGFSALATDVKQVETPGFILIAVLEPQIPLFYTKQKFGEPLPWPSEASPPVFLTTQRLRI